MGWFSGFNPHKTKTQLRLCIGRIKLLRNKKVLAVKTFRREIAELLAGGKEDSARIRVESVIRENNMLSAFEILELFCELLQVRMALIQQSKTVMDDTREAIASVIYAAQRLPDLPELIVVRAQFANKFGKEFCVDCNSDEKAVEKGVNRGLFNALSVATPSGLKKLTTLQEICEEYGVPWDAEEAAERIITASNTVFTSGVGASLGDAPAALDGAALDGAGSGDEEADPGAEPATDAELAAVLGLPFQPPEDAAPSAPSAGYASAEEAAAAARAAAEIAKKAAAAAELLSGQGREARAAGLAQVDQILNPPPAKPAFDALGAKYTSPGDMDALAKRFEDLKRRK